MERYRHSTHHQQPMFATMPPHASPMPPHATPMPPHAIPMPPRIATPGGMLHHQPPVGYHQQSMEQTRGVLHHPVTPHPEHSQPMYPQVMGFSLEDLDRVLYGYAKCGPSSNHALSGLRIGELSYGKITSNF